MGAPIDDFIVASNTNDILTRFVNDDDMIDRAGRADAQPEHGHPGVVELRAAAVRDERSRRRAAPPSSCERFRDGRPTRRRARPAARVRRRVVPGRAVDDDRDARRDRPRARRDRDADRPAHRHRHVAAARALAGRAPGRDAGDGAPGEVPRRRRAGDRHPAGAARRTSPTCSTAPSGSAVLPNDLAAVQAFVRSVARVAT